MQRTPHQNKRMEVKRIIDSALGSSKLSLSPLSIKIEDSFRDDYTTTEFSFQISQQDVKTKIHRNQKGKGYVDGLFSGLHGYFSSDYSSLKKIKLVDFSVNPIMSKSKNSFGTDAQASVMLSVHVPLHGISEFQHKSRSMIYSSFVSALEAFQFYINCESSFHKIQLFIEDAQSRNRGDIVNKYLYDLSKLTEVNNYEKREKN